MKFNAKVGQVQQHQSGNEVEYTIRLDTPVTEEIPTGIVFVDGLTQEEAVKFHPGVEVEVDCDDVTDISIEDLAVIPETREEVEAEAEEVETDLSDEVSSPDGETEEETEAKAE